jgi:3-dehydroquinate synthase
LTITLLTGIGTGHEVHEMDEALILESMTWLKNRAAR